jgi:hypothetical protein
MLSLSATSRLDKRTPLALASLHNSTLAWRIFFAGARPLRVIASSRPRCSGVRHTTYCFGTARRFVKTLAILGTPEKTGKFPYGHDLLNSTKLS